MKYGCASLSYRRRTLGASLHPVRLSMTMRRSCEVTWAWIRNATSRRQRTSSGTRTARAILPSHREFLGPIAPPSALGAATAGASSGWLRPEFAVDVLLDVVTTAYFLRRLQVTADGLGGHLVPLGCPVFVVAVIGKLSGFRSLYEVRSQVQISDAGRNRMQCALQALRHVGEHPITAFGVVRELAQVVHDPELGRHKNENQASLLCGAQLVSGGEGVCRFVQSSQIFLRQRLGTVTEVGGLGLSVRRQAQARALRARRLDRRFKEPLDGQTRAARKGARPEGVQEVRGVLEGALIPDHILQVIAFEKQPDHRVRV